MYPAHRLIVCMLRVLVHDDGIINLEPLIVEIDRVLILSLVKNTEAMLIDKTLVLYTGRMVPTWPHGENSDWS